MTPPFIIDIEGIIGAGKTTLIEKVIVPFFEDQGLRVTMVPEPVEEWTEILPLFYKDPSRWGYHFQTKALYDRIRVSEQVWKDCDADVIIMERSIWSDEIFMKTLQRCGEITEMEVKHYHNLWDMARRLMPFKPNVIFFLKPSIDTVMKRVEERARDGEDGISRDYQITLQTVHEEDFRGQVLTSMAVLFR